jgi:hypothetical protein
VNASTKEQDAALLADVASDHINDVIDFQVKCRDVTPLPPPSGGCRRCAPRRITRGNPLRADTVDPGTITTTRGPRPPLSAHRQTADGQRPVNQAVPHRTSASSINGASLAVCPPAGRPVPNSPTSRHSGASSERAGVASPACAPGGVSTGLLDGYACALFHKACYAR